MMSIAIKLIPQLSELEEVLNDPYKLHDQVEEAVVKLREVLGFDHDAGYRSTNCFDSAKSESSVSSGHNGNREKYIGGSSDERVQVGILASKEESQDIDSGHKTKMAGGEGAQRYSDELD